MRDGPLLTGFLQATLQGEAAYREIFRNPVTAVAWLPESIIVTQYQDASLHHISASGATAEGGLSAQIETLKLRDGETEQGNQAQRLTWAAGSQPQYTITLPADHTDAWNLTPDHALTFALASVPGEPVAAGLTISLAARAGANHSLPV